MNTSLNTREKRFIAVAAAIALVFGFTPVASAMHIMEGYLPVGFSVAWGVICIPFLIAGYMSIKKTLKENPKTITLLAMAGAYVFVLSSLKIPSVTGSCSHMTGTGLGAILFGPAAVSILGVIVLLFQAILLAHGGLTTLGANTFSMAIAGPFVTYGIFILCKKIKINRHVGVFMAAAIGDLFTYCITAFQLALAYPSESGGVGASVIKFLAVFAPTQLPLAIIEGILTVVIIIGLETYAQPELNDLGFLTGGVK
ncbi:MAG: energy-coupling factor ABC transporter permease [Acetobacterium sp.]|uniref:energy-coupling factor ABC transporter permease n=1 Tax=Acetobacterium sp. TaxID=1872094 RepID=UPI003241D6C0